MGGTALARPVKLCLAASGGGHLRQLLDLQPFWSRHAYVIVTEPTALADSLAADHPVRRVAHFAFGQRRTASWGALAWAGLRNMAASLVVIARERPTHVISTGAGSVFFVALFGWLFGARVVAIESFARFTSPSLFGRLVRPFAWAKVIQSAALHEAWPDATLCDPFRLLGTDRPAKQALAFVTVGTVMPFDRLLTGVAGLHAQGLLPERIVAQSGEGAAVPPGVEAHPGLPFARMQAILADADLVFTHGGTGSLVTALRAGCRVVAMPRDPARGEHYDDHQAEIVDAFAARGLIQVAREVADLPAALARARTMTVTRATTDYAELIQLLGRLIPQPALIAAPAAHTA